MAFIEPLLDADAKVQRPIILREVLTRKAICMAEGRRYTWTDLLSGLMICNLPVSRYMIANWLKEPWGREIQAELEIKFQATVREQYDQDFSTAVEKQFDLAINGTPRNKVMAFTNLLNLAEKAGYLDEDRHTEAAKAPNIQVLYQLYADPIQLAKNAKAVTSLVLPPNVMSQGEPPLLNVNQEPNGTDNRPISGIETSSLDIKQP